MPSALSTPLAESIAAAQAWWRDAGVDYAYGDEAKAWLAEEAPPIEVKSVPAKVLPPPRPKIGGDPASWPRDLAGFRQWWLEEPGLGFGSNPRLLPRGETGAALMIMVPMPEPEDRDTLLEGPQGRLLASLALALGLAPEAVYVASALPQHGALPDWQRLGDHGLGEVLLHHLGLAAPERLMILGSSVLPLLGHGPAQAAPAVSELSIQGRKLPLLTGFAPERLLGNARQRAALWQRCLEWTDEG